MKKIISFTIFSILILVIVIAVLFNSKGNKKEEKLRKLKVAEVAHTVFYAPQYVAIEKGFFKEEGLDIELILTPGADKVTAAVLSNDADIGFSGFIPFSFSTHSRVISGIPPILPPIIVFPFKSFNVKLSIFSLDTINEPSF